MVVKIKKKNKIIIMLIIILIFAFLIRFETLIQPRDFWIDESYQYAISQKSMSFIIDSPDVHPPLFNLFTKGLISIGITDYMALRFVMVTLSIILIITFFFTVKEIFNDNIALYSTILLSFCLTYIYYATEFRSYTFILIFTILQIKYFNRLIFSKISRFDSLYLLLFSLLMIYSHYMAGLLIFAEFVYLIVNWNKFRIHKQSEILGVAFYLFAFSIPLVIYILRTLPKIQSFWFKDIDLISLVSTFSYILAPPMKDGLIFLLIYPILFFIIFIHRKDFDIKIQQFLYYLIIPIILMWTISQVIAFYHHRYFLFGGLSIFILLGWAFNKLDTYKKDLGLFFIALFLFIGVGVYPDFVGTFNTELYEASINLSKIDDDSILIHTSTFSYLPFKVYFPKNTQYLVTNLTTQQLFTAGGSVVEEQYIKNDIEEVPLVTGHSYAISDYKIFEEEVTNVRGLYVTKK